MNALQILKDELKLDELTNEEKKDELTTLFINWINPAIKETTIGSIISYDQDIKIVLHEKLNVNIGPLYIYKMLESIPSKWIITNKDNVYNVIQNLPHIASKQMNFKEDMIAIILNKRIINVNQCCYRKCNKTTDGGRKFRCKGCEEIRYCNKNCQKRDWGRHKLFCSKLYRIYNKK